MTLAAFAQIQSLIATLNEHIRITPHAEMCAVAMSVKEQPSLDSNLCDDCHHQQQKPLDGPDVATAATSQKAEQQQERAKQQIVMHEDEDGYCELVKVAESDRRRRSSSIRKYSPEECGLTNNSCPELEENMVESGSKQVLKYLNIKEEVPPVESGESSYYRSAMKMKEQLLTSTQSVPLSLIAANLLSLNQTITKLLVSKMKTLN